MSQPSNEDTHSRILALENSNGRMESAISGVAESMQRLALAVERLTTYQQEHDKAAERAGKRIEELEIKVSGCDAKFHKWLYIGFGVWIVVGGLISFVGSYVVDGVFTLSREIHEFDKRIDRLERGVQQSPFTGASFSCEDEQRPGPKGPPQIPPPDTIATDRPMDGI